MDDDKKKLLEEKYDPFNFVQEDGPYEEEEEEPEWMEHQRDYYRNLI
jgi:hypothetical protein